MLGRRGRLGLPAPAAGDLQRGGLVHLHRWTFQRGVVRTALQSTECLRDAAAAGDEALQAATEEQTMIRIARIKNNNLMDPIYIELH